MPATTTIRDLRNHFPKVRKLVETRGEVIVTENGEPKYRLTLHTPAATKAPAAVDYWARLIASQPAPLSPAQSQQLHDENRGRR